MPDAGPIEKRLQISAALVILGLLVEAVCLLWARPIAFILFVGLGGLLIIAGIIVYLFSLASIGPQSSRQGRS